MSDSSLVLVCPGCHQPTDPSSSQCDHCRYLHLGRLVPGVPPPIPAEPEPEQDERESAPPGWYDTPAGGRQRYWDGTQWRQSWFGQGSGEAAPENDGLATIGWVTAILFPIAGLVVGIMLSSRNDRRGMPIAITSVAVFVAWIVFWIVINLILASSVSAGY